MTNWLLSHAVRSLNSCPEEFFDLLPVVSNLNINNIPIQIVKEYLLRAERKGCGWPGASVD